MDVVRSDEFLTSGDSEPKILSISEDLAGPRDIASNIPSIVSLPSSFLAFQSLETYLFPSWSAREIRYIFNACATERSLFRASVAFFSSVYCIAASQNDGIRASRNLYSE